MKAYCGLRISKWPGRAGQARSSARYSRRYIFLRKSIVLVLLRIPCLGVERDFYCWPGIVKRTTDGRLRWCALQRNSVPPGNMRPFYITTHPLTGGKQNARTTE